MLSSFTKSAFATSGIEIFTLPIPVQTSTESTESTPNTAITEIFLAFRPADACASVGQAGDLVRVFCFMLF